MPPKKPTRPFVEGTMWWGPISPDKNTLRVHGGILNLDRVAEFQQKGMVTVTNAGGAYWDIGFHPEGLIPWLTMLEQVAWWLAYLALRGLFRFDVAAGLIQVLSPAWNWQDPSNVILYVEALDSAGFTWAEAEVAADYETKERPVRVTTRDACHKFRSTRYSNDGVRTYRLILRDGIPTRESKGSRKDTVIEYNRARKIGLDRPQWRVELRLQRHHLERLSLYDLAVPFHFWVWVRTPWLVKFLKKAVEPGTWGTSLSAQTPGHWLFREILREAGWFEY